MVKSDKSANAEASNSKERRERVEGSDKAEARYTVHFFALG
jgi:hypothetical protein